MYAKYKALLDKLPSGPVLFFGSFYFIMPILPEPHLWQKFQMIMNGAYMQPIDYLDIVLHTAGGFLALTKFLRDRELAKLGASGDGSGGDGAGGDGAGGDAAAGDNPDSGS